MTLAEDRVAPARALWLAFLTGFGFFILGYGGILLSGHGRMIGLIWPAAILFCVIWLVIAVALRYSSLSALIASVITPIVLWWFGQAALATLATGLTLLLFFMHRENIKRLMAGTEGKIGQKA